MDKKKLNDNRAFFLPRFDAALDGAGRFDMVGWGCVR